VVAKLVKEGVYNAPTPSLIILPPRSSTISSRPAHTATGITSTVVKPAPIYSARTTLIYFNMPEPSLHPSNSRDSSSHRSDSSTGTTATSVGSLPVQKEDESPELKELPSSILSQFSGPGLAFPQFDTPPNIEDIEGVYPYDITDPLSNIYQRPVSALRTPSDRKYHWALSTTLYTSPLDDTKVGSSFSSLAYGPTQEDAAAGHQMSTPVVDAASVFNAGFSRLSEDLVNTMNITTPSGRGCRDPVAVTADFTKLWARFAGKHTVCEFRDLANTVVEEGYKYIDEWRADLQAAGGNVQPKEEIIRTPTLHWVSKQQADIRV
jgi:hypothetical protein